MVKPLALGLRKKGFTAVFSFIFGLRSGPKGVLVEKVRSLLGEMLWTMGKKVLKPSFVGFSTTLCKIYAREFVILGSSCILLDKNRCLSVRGYSSELCFTHFGETFSKKL